MGNETGFQRAPRKSGPEKYKFKSTIEVSCDGNSATGAVLKWTGDLKIEQSEDRVRSTW